MPVNCAPNEVVRSGASGPTRPVCRRPDWNHVVKGACPSPDPVKVTYPARCRAAGSGVASTTGLVSRASNTDRVSAVSESFGCAITTRSRSGPVMLV